MNLKYKIGTSIATATLLGSILTGSAFATDLEISGNGVDSTNKIIVNNSNSTNVGQSNEMIVETEIVSLALTGGNKANSNTGGDVSIDTGNATSTVNVSVSGGSNTATVEPCPCDSTRDALISGNGDGTYNKIKQNNSNSTNVGQLTGLGVGTAILSKAKTGKNRASRNTGGTTGITTGNSISTVGVGVTGPSNTLNP
ncbi:MAG: hypothetical protein Q7K55_08645 [Candidatus Levybacteria bacterium]|nr:hypothetical protein [Candidatus Levybacteria bacterium]